jgi:hypothetical protein
MPTARKESNVFCCCDNKFSGIMCIDEKIPWGNVNAHVLV